MTYHEVKQMMQPLVSVRYFAYDILSMELDHDRH